MRAFLAECYTEQAFKPPQDYKKLPLFTGKNFFREGVLLLRGEPSADGRGEGWRLGKCPALLLCLLRSP